MALLGYPILSITRKQNDGDADRFINEYRQMVGQHVTYNHGKSSMLSIGRYLKDKHLVGILYDQDSAHTGEHLELFGKPARVLMGQPSWHGSSKLPLSRFSCIISLMGRLRPLFIPVFTQIPN